MSASEWPRLMVAQVEALEREARDYLGEREAAMEDAAKSAVDVRARATRRQERNAASDIVFAARDLARAMRRAAAGVP